MSVSLVQACADRNLVGLDPHPKQLELLELLARNRLVVAACGRRFGKTKAAAAAALHNLLLVPELDALVSPGEARYAVSVANSQLQARLFVQHALALVQASPTLSHELVRATANELVFRGNRILAAFPCSSRSGRGWPISFLSLDEFAHFFDIEEGGPAVASRVWAAMTPSVAQFAEYGRVVVISTPWGSEGLFAELFKKAQNGEIPDAAAFHAPTSANPLIDSTFLAAQEAALGADDYQQEYGAEFAAGGAGFIEYNRLMDVVEDRRELTPTDGTGWILGLDPAFSSDPTAIAVVGRDPWDPGQLVLGRVQRWLPEKRKRKLRRTREDEDRAIGRVLDDVAEIAKTYDARVTSDQHLPGTIEHELRMRGVVVSIDAWTSTTRTEAFRQLRARIYTRRISLYAEPQLITELCRLRTKYRAGTSTVELPKVGDSHCDEASALAAAVWAHDRHGVHSGAPLPPLAEPSSRTRAISKGLVGKVF